MFGFLAALSGYKTYLVAAAVAGTAVAKMLGYEIPEWIWGMYGAAGLGTLRDALNKVPKV